MGHPVKGQFVPSLPAVRAQQEALLAAVVPVLALAGEAVPAVVLTQDLLLESNP